MNKIFSMMGLATKAGKTVSGEFSVEKAIRENKAKLVVVSREASENTKKLFLNKCAYYKIPVYIYGTKKELGCCTGKAERASVAILEEGFSKSIINMLDNK